MLTPACMELSKRRRPELLWELKFDTITNTRGITARKRRIQRPASSSLTGCNRRSCRKPLEAVVSFKFVEISRTVGFCTPRCTASFTATTEAAQARWSRPDANRDRIFNLSTSCIVPVDSVRCSYVNNCCCAACWQELCVAQLLLQQQVGCLSTQLIPFLLLHTRAPACPALI